MENKEGVWLSENRCLIIDVAPDSTKTTADSVEDLLMFDDYTREEWDGDRGMNKKSA